jgi:hypothetical protein
MLDGDRVRQQDFATDSGARSPGSSESSLYRCERQLHKGGEPKRIRAPAAIAQLRFAYSFLPIRVFLVGTTWGVAQSRRVVQTVWGMRAWPWLQQIFDPLVECRANGSWRHRRALVLLDLIELVANDRQPMLRGTVSMLVPCWL